MTPEAWVLAAFGLVVSTLGTVAVFRRGQGDSIDRRRETELTRLGQRLDKVEEDLHLVAGVAYRAVRRIQADGGVPFPLTSDEVEALERTRPIGPTQ